MHTMVSTEYRSFELLLLLSSSMHTLEISTSSYWYDTRATLYSRVVCVLLALLLASTRGVVCIQYAYYSRSY